MVNVLFVLFKLILCKINKPAFFLAASNSRIRSVQSKDSAGSQVLYDLKFSICLVVKYNKYKCYQI